MTASTIWAACTGSARWSRLVARRRITSAGRRASSPCTCWWSRNVWARARSPPRPDSQVALRARALEAPLTERGLLPRPAGTVPFRTTTSPMLSMCTKHGALSRLGLLCSVNDAVNVLPCPTWAYMTAIRPHLRCPNMTMPGFRPPPDYGFGGWGDDLASQTSLREPRRRAARHTGATPRGRPGAAGRPGPGTRCPTRPPGP